MKKSDVQRWLDNNADKIYRKFGLEDWEIFVELKIFSRKDSENEAGNLTTFMMTTFDPKYRNGTIEIDYTAISNYTELRRHFQHELCHFLHSPFELFWNSAKSYFKKTSDYNAMIEAYNNAEELTVLNIEKLIKRNGKQM